MFSAVRKRFPSVIELSTIIKQFSSIVNEAISINSFFLRRDFKWKETRNKQSPPSYEVFVRKKFWILLFSIHLFLFCWLVFTCFVFFVLQKFFLKKSEFVLIASFTILLK